MQYIEFLCQCNVSDVDGLSQKSVELSGVQNCTEEISGPIIFVNLNELTFENTLPGEIQLNSIIAITTSSRKPRFYNRQWLFNKEP